LGDAFDFSNFENLAVWLREQPPPVARAVAARSALRVLPLVFEGVSNPDDNRQLLLQLQALRAALVCWTSCLSENYARELAGPARDAFSQVFSVAASGAAAAAMHSAAYAARAVAEASETVGVAAQAIQAAEVAVGHAADASETVDQGVAADALWLKKNSRSKWPVLIRQPLWLNEVKGSKRYSTNFPIWIRKPFDVFDKSGYVLEGPWGVWLAWYREILPGFDPSRARYFKADKAFEVANQNSEFWSGLPESVTARVAEIVGWKWSEGSRKSPRKPDSPPQPTSDSPSELVRPQSDEPTKDDQLNRRPFARALVERMDEVHAQNGSDGFAVHVHAPWGAGKTSALLMMRELMTKDDRKSAGGRPAPHWVVVHFDAWKHERRNPPWWPLMEAVKTACLARLSERPISGWRLCKALFDEYDQAARLQTRWLWWKIKTDALPYLAAIAFGAICLWLFWSAGTASDGKVPAIFEWLLKLVTAAIAAFAAFTGASRIAVFGTANAAKYYEDLSQDPLKRITQLFRDIVVRTNAPVCIFIDDLDRCRADYVVDLLEGIQTAFRHKNVAYVVAADRNWIKASFENRYGMFSSAVGNPGQPLGHLFLEKVFQVSTPLPGMGRATRSRYWDHLLRGVPAVQSAPAARQSSADAIRLSEQVVESEREKLRAQYGNSITRSTADQILTETATSEERAAVALELSASPATRAEATHLLSQFRDVVPDIPRVMKRMINAFALRQAIGVLEGSAVSTAVLARWTILEQRYPALSELLTAHPEWLEYISAEVKVDKKRVLPEAIKPFENSKEIIGIVGKGSDTALDVEAVRGITSGFSS